MADTKLTDLTLKNPLVGTDEIYINDVAGGNLDKKGRVSGIRITESQISDLQAYLADITGEPLSDLSDVTITGIASGEILKWNGSAWINNTLAEASISAVGHTHTESDITDLGSYITASSTDTITNKTINTASNTITVVEADISDLQAYITDITGEPLSTLSDVTITAIASGELLKWNGSAWINNTLAEAGISATGHTHTESDISDLGTTVAMVADNLSVFANTTKAQLEGILSDVTDIAEADGDTWTGVHDFGGATSLEVPNSATPTVDADGEIALDTTVTDFSHGVLKYYGGEEMAVVAMPIAELTSPTDTHVVTYNATNDEFELAAGGGGGGTFSVQRVEPSSNVTITTTSMADITGITLTLANVSGGFFMANHVINFAHDSSTGLCYVQFVEGATTHPDNAMRNVAINQRTVMSQTLTGDTDGDTLKAQGRTNTGTLTYQQGTNQMSHLEVIEMG